MMSKKIFFLPNVAIEYIGDKEQEFSRSLARPKPIVKKGDVVIMDKVNAYNIVKMFPTLWKKVEGECVEVANDEELKLAVEELEERVEELESENEELAEVVAKIDLEEQESEEDEATLPIEDENTLDDILQARESFVRKADLKAYAKESFEIELEDGTLDVMYQTLVDIVNQKKVESE